MGLCDAMDTIGATCVVAISFFFPPVGVALVSGCSPDLVINVALTCLGWFPGILHALYVESVFFSRQAAVQRGDMLKIEKKAPGIMSQRVQTGGLSKRKPDEEQAIGGTGAPAAPATAAVPPPAPPAELAPEPAETEPTTPAAEATAFMDAPAPASPLKEAEPAAAKQ
ncbi:uncharacterized protein V1510DRAFT_429239 [Dipodascopsis tothii]|uniref:uncharacterized protein n=1 Tax=Dipodascopsis tothii TaxID=44089 RepID=UPI0034CDAF76